MFLVGLSGGIASGKSTVVAVLRELGCAVIDADVIAREGEFCVADLPPRGSPDNWGGCGEAQTAEGALGTFHECFHPVPWWRRQPGAAVWNGGEGGLEPGSISYKEKKNHVLMKTVARSHPEVPSPSFESELWAQGAGLAVRWAPWAQPMSPPSPRTAPP